MPSRYWEQLPSDPWPQKVTKKWCLILAANLRPPCQDWCIVGGLEFWVRDWVCRWEDRRERWGRWSPQRQLGLDADWLRGQRHLVLACQVTAGVCRNGRLPRLLSQNSSLCHFFRDKEWSLRMIGKKHLMFTWLNIVFIRKQRDIYDRQSEKEECWKRKYCRV